VRQQSDSTAVADSLPLQELERVSIDVDSHHPLLRLKRALDWEAIQRVMVAAWRKANKNIDGRPGLSWPVSLYVPLLVLMLVKKFDSRQMEHYLAENVVARVFLCRQDDPTPQIRDHSSIARAMEALGAEGVQQVNQLILEQAERYGFADPALVSGDTTAQELPIGYPNEPGILRGLAQRCLRALVRLSQKGVAAVEETIQQAKAGLQSVKQYHLFTKQKKEKDLLLRRIIEQTQDLIRGAGGVVETVRQSTDRVQKSACQKLLRMKQVAETLIPQIMQWMSTGVVAKGKIVHAGITQARAIVRNKVGKKVEFGLKYLINRIGGGYVFGKLVAANSDERKMPLETLSSYREVFGKAATPEWISYHRGGWSELGVQKLAKAGIKKIGIEPKGKADWLIAEEDQKRVKSERGKMEGSIGTLKSEKYGFNKPKERKWEMIQAAGQRSMVSLNLNKLMRDLVTVSQQAKTIEA
jgi:hypothetical protein